MGICGVAVLMIFQCGDAVNKISICGVAVISNPRRAMFVFFTLRCSVKRNCFAVLGCFDLPFSNLNLT